MALSICICAAVGAWAASRPSGELDKARAGPVASSEPVRPQRTIGRQDDWTTVLNGLSERRSEAWQRGRPELLDQVFLRGSAALQRDRRAMRAYVARGLTVDRVEMRFDRVDEVRRSSRRAVTLRVTDRLARVVVSWTGGQRALPIDEATQHVVQLQWTEHGWRIASVRVRAR